MTRVGLRSIGTHVAVSHSAQCPDISPVICAEQVLPEHTHDQTITWARVQPAVQVGLGKGWQAHLEVPVDTKRVTIDYYLPDGTPYAPPYAGTHHRNETLVGLADPAVGLKTAVIFGELMLTPGLQLRLPLGQTEENPYALAEQGLEHQHFQMGSGIPIPEGSIDAVRMGVRWGWLAFGQGRLPLHENSKGYTPGWNASLGAGAIWRASPTVMLTGVVEGTREGKDQWDGVPSPSSGRDLIVGALSAEIGIGDGWSLEGAMRFTVHQKASAEDPGDQLLQRVVVAAGMSKTFGKTKP